MTDTYCLGESEDAGSNPKHENDNSCIKNSDRPYQTHATCVVPNIACPDDIEVMGSNFIHVPSNIHTVHSPNEQNYCSPETADQTISVVHRNPVVYTQGVNHTEVMGLNPTQTTTNQFRTNVTNKLVTNLVAFLLMTLLPIRAQTYSGIIVLMFWKHIG